MWEPLTFVQKYFDLLAYCAAKDVFDQKEFKRLHNEYAKRYEKLKQDEQGLIAENISKRLLGAE